MDQNINTDYIQTPIDINENLFYSSEIKKGVLEVRFKAVDEEGETTKVNKTKKLFSVENLSREDNTLKFNWKFTNYANADVSQVIEIINSKYDVIFSSEIITKGQTFNEIISTEINNKTINDKEKYYYRLRLYNNDELYQFFYPNYKGILIDDEATIYKMFEKNIEGGFSFLDTYINKRLEEGNLDTQTIKTLLRLYTNPRDVSVTRIDNNPDKYKMDSIYNNYAELINDKLHGEKSQFVIKENNHFKSEMFKLDVFRDGKKVFINDYLSQLKFDGLGKVYIRTDEINKNSFIEVESKFNKLKHSERIIARHTISTKEEIKKLYSFGINIKTDRLKEFFRSSEMMVFVKFRNTTFFTRVNPYRTKISVSYGEDGYFINTQIKDATVSQIGNEILIISENVVNDIFFKVDAYNKILNTYQIPCYFIPYSYITSEGDFINDLSNDIEGTDIYVNGFRLYNKKDFIILNPILHLQLPSMILFKDIVNFDSKIEVIHNNILNDSIYYTNKLSKRNDVSYLLLPEGYPPLIEKTFHIYIDNLKVPEDSYHIINRRLICFENIKSIDNILLKFNYQSNDDIVIRLLELYDTKKPLEDMILENKTYIELLDEYISKHSIQKFKKEEQESYLGLKYINQLDDFYNFLKDLYNITKEGSIKHLNANVKYLYTHKETPLVIDDTKILHYLFNHSIKLNCNRNYDNNHMEDNISIINMGRIFQLINFIDEKVKNEPEENIIIDCNNFGLVDFDTHLNENIDLNIPYINNSLIVDCNQNLHVEDYSNDIDADF